MNKDDFFKKTKTAFALVMKISQVKKKDERVFCVYEGKDNYYYYPIIEKHNCEKYEILNFFADGKEGVLDVHRLLKQHNIRIRGIFCVDKDFDDNSKINPKDIYITKGYSVENFYTGKKTYSEICKNNFYCSRQALINNFIRKKEEFHSLVAVVNKIGKLSNREGLGIKFKGIKIKDFIDINYNKISYKRGIKPIENFLNEKLANGEDFDFNKINKVTFGDCDYEFRGKFEFEFMYMFLKVTKDYVKKNKLNEAKFALKGVEDCSEGFMDRFSKYSEVPDELANYIKKVLQ